MDRYLLQADVAAMLHVTESTIYNWEAGMTPAIEHMPDIIKLLGYLPAEIDTSTLAGEVKRYRYIYGMSQKELAKTVGVDESTVIDIERGLRDHHSKTLRKLIILLRQP